MYLLQDLARYLAKIIIYPEALAKKIEDRSFHKSRKCSLILTGICISHDLIGSCVSEFVKICQDLLAQYDFVRSCQDFNPIFATCENLSPHPPECLDLYFD